MTPTPHDLNSKAAVLALADCAHSDHARGLSDENGLNIAWNLDRSTTTVNQSSLSRLRWVTQSRPEFRSAITPPNESQDQPVTAEAPKSAVSHHVPHLVDARTISRRAIGRANLPFSGSLSLSRLPSPRSPQFSLTQCEREVVRETVRHELRKTCHEKRNASQRPPTGGEPHCHSRRWSVGRTLR